MSLSKKQILSVISRELPDFSPTGELRPLSGGNLNQVWRLEGKPENLIVKHAPPYITSDPEVSLSPERIHFEAKALKLFEKNGALQFIGSDHIRPPHIYQFDKAEHLLIMEDVGEAPYITKWLVNKASKSDAYLAAVLGDFIGQLHSYTFQNKLFKNHFNNSDIQQTRVEMQYKPAAEYAKRAGITDVEVIRTKTETLGKKLLSQGCCLIMGDLWPPSVLVKDGKIRLVDWEFAHYGRPLQDVAHFSAHFWMQAHISPKNKKRFLNCWKQFWGGYRQALGEKFTTVFDEEELNNAATHIGAEILIRAAGPFKKGYVYEDFDSDSRMIKDARKKAQELILADDFSSLWN